MRPIIALPALLLAARCESGVTSRDASAPSGDASVDAPPLVVPDDFVVHGHETDLPSAGPASVVDAAAGTRLRPVRWQGGGASLFAWWFDRALNLECTYRRASDGEFHCLPRDVITSDGEYADPTCHSVDSPVGRWPNLDCPLPAHGTASRADTCPQSSEVRLRGARWQGAPSQLSADGMCRSLGLSDYYKLEELVPPEMFVRAAVKQGPSPSGHLGTLYLEGEDGSRQLRSWRDIDGGFDCSLGLAADGKLRCLPIQEQPTTGGPYPSLFADAQCTQPAMAPHQSACAPETQFFRRSTPAGGCPGPLSVYRGKERLKSGYVLSSGQCHPNTAQPRYELVSLGDELPAGGFKEGTYGAIEGTGRLRVRAMITEAGVAAGPTFWDPKFGCYCQPTLASDGVLRCLPIPLGDGDPVVYARPDCSGPPLASTSEMPGCQRAFLIRDVADGCVRRRGVHPLSASVVTEAVPIYDRTLGECRPIATSITPVLRAVGPEIPPTEFQELKLVTE